MKNQNMKKAERTKIRRQNQEGKGLKIHNNNKSPQQMLSRLPITLAQLKAGIIHKNSKLK